MSLCMDCYLLMMFFKFPPPPPARPTTPLSVGAIVPPPRPASRPKLTSGKLSGINEIVCTQVFLLFNYNCFDLRYKWYLSVCLFTVKCLGFSTQSSKYRNAFPYTFFIPPSYLIIVPLEQDIIHKEKDFLTKLAHFRNTIQYPLFHRWEAIFI